MQVDYELKHHELEATYWFFVVRRALIKRLLFDDNRAISVLEIGCASGVLMEELGEMGFANIFGVDVSQVAIDTCKKNGISNALLGDGVAIPFDDDSFDVVISSDVLEHIEDDSKALREWHRVLKPGGKLIMLTPAFPFLWSKHDVVNKHHRRYTKSKLVDLISKTGFVVKRVSYWNITLFLPALIIKFLLRFKRSNNSNSGGHLYGQNRLANKILAKLLQIDNTLIANNIDLPIGVSLLVWANKK